jgi:hypothetical protein
MKVKEEGKGERRMEGIRKQKRMKERRKEGKKKGRK